MRTALIIAFGFMVTLIGGFILAGLIGFWPIWTALVPLSVLIILLYPTPWTMTVVVWAALLIEVLTHGPGGTLVIPTLIAVLLWPVIQRRVDMVPLLFAEAWTVGNLIFHIGALVVLMVWYTVAEVLISRFLWHTITAWPIFSFSLVAILLIHLVVILVIALILRTIVRRGGSLRYRL